MLGWDLILETSWELWLLAPWITIQDKQEIVFLRVGDFIDEPFCVFHPRTNPSQINTVGKASNIVRLKNKLSPF